MAVPTEIITMTSLSGGTNYEGDALTASFAALHTSGASTSVQDEVWVWACNTHATDFQTVTVGVGTGGSPAAEFEYDIPPKVGLSLIVPGWTFQNSKILYGKGETNGVITVFGYVNRIT